MSRRRITKLGDAVSRVLSESGVAGGLRLEAVREKWRAAVGQEIAARTRVLGFTRGVLRVEVTSSALLQELASVYRGTITRSLAAGDRPVTVRDIRFELPR